MPQWDCKNVAAIKNLIFLAVVGGTHLSGDDGVAVVRALLQFLGSTASRQPDRRHHILGDIEKRLPPERDTQG